MKRKFWLENFIEEYIKNNPKMDSVDIISHFKLSADVVFESLGNLEFDNKIIRKHLFGTNYGYIINQTKL